MLVPKDLVGLHRTIQLQLLQHSDQGIDLDYWERETRGRPGRFSQFSDSRGLLASSIAVPHYGPKHTGWGWPPRQPEGEGRGTAVTDTYLCPSSRTAEPATRPRSGALAPGAKQAFIAALAARLRRRAAQRISKTEGNCSPASWSPRLLSRLQPVHSEGDQPWDFFGRNDAKAETPVLWPCQQLDSA